MNKKSKKTKKCLSCKPTAGLIAKTTKKRANWKSRRGMKTIFPDDKIPSLKNVKLVHPKDYDQTVTLNLGEKMKNRYVLFYASKKNKITDCEKIRSASEAYDSFQNRGMTKTNSKGIANLKLKCPQVYQEEGEVYFSHVHFIVSNKNNTDSMEPSTRFFMQAAGAFDNAIHQNRELLFFTNFLQTFNPTSRITTIHSINDSARNPLKERT